MRLITTFLLCLFVISANAQLIEVPLLGNPVLQSYHQNNIPISFRSGTVMPETIVPAGGTSMVCIDTTTVNLSGTIATATCTNCMDANFGTASISGICVTYNATAGNDQVTDDICIEVCSADPLDCNLFTFPFAIRSAFQLNNNNAFFDDFSYAGPFPDQSLWLDKDVYINNTLANNPPSVGFATFDGIDFTGTPYGGGYGLSDQLTTNFIDLSGFSNGSEVYLSFHVQEKGLGIGPLAGDSLVVELKDADGNWNTLEIFEPGTGSGIPSEFFPISRSITDPLYFHNNFQLRFTNYSRRQGALEFWHVDYIAISATPLINGLYDDIAFVNVPTTFLDRYTSMPWRHFENNVADEITNAYFVNIVNHFDTENDVQNTSQNITEINTGIEIADFVLLSGSQFNITDTLPVLYESQIPGGIETSMIGSLESNFSGFTNLAFETTYAYNVGNEQSGSNAVLRNDTVRSITRFENYFAHDDGTAETGVIAPNVGDRIAVQYHANVGDSLRGVQFHFPRIQNGTDGQLFNMQIYVGELDDDPEFELIFQNPYFIDTDFDSLQGFTNYGLLDFDGNPTPLFIPEGDFYVGWQQVTNSESAIPVGLDKNNLEASQYGFYSSATDWNPIGPGGLVDGAIMVRPVFGDETPYNTPVNEIESYQNDVLIYPNPANQFINIENVSDAEEVGYQIMTATGRIVKSGTVNGTIGTADLLNGMYFININDPKKGSISKRFLVVR